MNNESFHHFEALAIRILSLHPIPDGEETDNTVPLRHTNTPVFQCEENKKWEKNRERERGVPDRRPAADAAAHFFVSDIYLLLCLFFPKDMETWPSNREVSERFLFYNALKLFPYG